MQKNLVPLDRAVRLGGGLLLLATPLLELPTFPYNLLGIVPLATAFVGFCPLYRVAGWLFGKRRGTDDTGLPRDLTPHGGLTS